MVNPATRFNGKTKIDALHIDSSAWYIDGEQVIVTADELNQGLRTYPIYNATGGTTSPGMPLHISGYDATSGYYKVEKADANAGLQCQLFAINSTAKNTTTDAKTYYVGTGNGIDCSAGAAIGDPVYLSETAGEVTLARPTASDDFVQIVGRVGSTANPGVLALDASFGEIYKIGSGQLSAEAVGSTALAAKGVTAAKLNADVVGVGLTGGNGVAISLSIPANGIALTNLPIGFKYVAFSPEVDLSDGVAKDVDFGVIGANATILGAYFNIDAATDEDVALTVCKSVSGSNIVIPAYNLLAASTTYPNVAGGVAFAKGSSASIVSTDHLYVHVPAKASARVAGKLYVTVIMAIVAPPA